MNQLEKTTLETIEAARSASIPCPPENDIARRALLDVENELQECLYNTREILRKRDNAIKSQRQRKEDALFAVARAANEFCNAERLGTEKRYNENLHFLRVALEDLRPIFKLTEWEGTE